MVKTTNHFRKHTKDELSVFKRGKFKILKPNFTKLTSGLIKGPHIKTDKILSEYEISGGRH